MTEERQKLFGINKFNAHTPPCRQCITPTFAQADCDEKESCRFVRLIDCCLYARGYRAHVGGFSYPDFSRYDLNTGAMLRAYIAQDLCADRH